MRRRPSGRGQRRRAEGVWEHWSGHESIEIGGGQRRRPRLDAGGGASLRWKEEAGGIGAGRLEEASSAGTRRRLRPVPA
jgi:hypothetical protein